MTRKAASRGRLARATGALALGAFAALAATAGVPPRDGGSRAPLERKKFEWVSVKRDPFEFRPIRKTVTERPGPGPKWPWGKKPNGPGPKPGNGKIDASVAQNVVKFAAKRARDAEMHLLQRQYSEAADVATEALNRIKADQFPDMKLLARLRRFRDTAQRLAERAKIEKRFNQLPISIEGIVWEPGNAVALVNGDPKRVGDIVEGVKIGEIRRREVIFVLEKGVRVRRRPLSAGAD